MITFGLGLLLGGIQIYWDFQRQQREFSKTNDYIIELVTPTAARAVHTLDSELAAEVVAGLLSYNFVKSVQVVDELGNVLAEAENSNDAPSKLLWMTELLGDRYQTYQADLVLNEYEGYQAGRVAYTVDLSIAYQSLYQRSITYLGSDLFRNFVLIGLLCVIFYSYFTRPILRLAREMESINFYKPGSRRFSLIKYRSDEISRLVDNGNRLLESVELALDSQRSVEIALRKSEEHLRQLIDRLPVFVAARNRDGYLVFVNKAWASVFGMSPDHLRYVKFKDVVGEKLTNADEILARDKKVFDSHEDFFVAEERWFDHNHQPLYWQSHYTLLQFHDEPVALVVSTDISDRKKSEADIAYMAYHDSLTRLPNRMHLVERLENELHRAKRHKYYGAVLFIDLDQFKNINDSLGHPVGDVVLVEIARRLQQTVRDEDLVARLGGDEFVLVLTVLDTDLTQAIHKATEVGEKIRVCLADPVYHDNLELRVTCSIGAVMFPDEGLSVHELLRYADTAMYRVKEGGRNSIAFFNETMAEQVKSQLVLEGQLHKAVEEHQFELVYQAKVSVATGELTGAEALLRWKHPEKGLIGPGYFIGTLENTGLIVEVGQWILEEACRKLQEWQQMGVWQSGMRLSINISPRQFRRSEFVDDVKATLRDIPIEYGSLDIEVTEGVVIGNIDDTASTMRELCDIGISFSLDDFGTGYSSISYLKRLPVATLKIDQSFVRDIRIDRSDKVLVESMASMGRLLGLKVVAEGVEEAEQLALIKEFGCDEYQGYYFSRPISADKFLELLRDSHGEIQLSGS
ncbi:putative bifunctional diguanylate cyclase/phosphodiesterase [Halioxenophilus sp. WMMB6]|uniref:putative bifunctional diguanylate cyclase/phosphodiesterase n=1 Tax=Halioxenophilus sp. WMMB6 TaxID=3073815 RepID=UPI00295E2D3F|nr:EAL domain-containing protein [Halioxenophilus sp. WMMB6]